MTKKETKNEETLEAVIYGLRIVYTDTDPTPTAKKSKSKSKSKKPILVFLHDWCSNRQSFREQISVLKDTYRCISLDLPGHGRSSKPNLNYSVVLVGEVIAGFISQLNAENITLIGHGYGACAGLETASQQQNDVTRLVLINPYPLFADKASKAAVAERKHQFETLGFRRYFKKAVATELFDTRDADHFREWAIKTMTRVPDHVGVSMLDSCADWPGKTVLRALSHLPINYIFTSNPVHHPDDLKSLSPKMKWGRAFNRSFYGHLTVPEEVNGLLKSALKYT